MNVSGAPSPEYALAELFRLLSQPTRLQILLAVGEGEACVCHLEAALGLRQAYISQQLMALRDAGLVSSMRHGRNIYYRLANPRLLGLVRQAAELLNIPKLPFDGHVHPPIPGCPCPPCAESRGIEPDNAPEEAKE